MEVSFLANLNICDSWWTDPRRHELIEQLGSELLADGLAIKIWRISQDYWKHDKRLIPEKIFAQIEHKDVLLECGLAAKKGKNFYVNGTVKNHTWIESRIRSASKGGKTKRKDAKQNPSKIQANTPLCSGPNINNNNNTNTNNNNMFSKISATDIQSCMDEWQKTLTHFGIGKRATLDEIPIVKLLLRHGTESVLSALAGARNESMHPGFNPADHISIFRFENEKNFAKFQNLGSKAIQPNNQIQEVPDDLQILRRNDS